MSYTLYQIVSRGHAVFELSPRKIIRLVRMRIKPEARRDRKLRTARHDTYRSLVQHLKDDQQLMKDFRL